MINIQLNEPWFEKIKVGSSDMVLYLCIILRIVADLKIKWLLVTNLFSTTSLLLVNKLVPL